MRPTVEVVAWVVYRMTLSKVKNTVGGNVVCSQREWDALEASQPGYHTLVRAGIATEQEAEKLARGTAGDARPRKPWQARRADRSRRERLGSASKP